MSDRQINARLWRAETMVFRATVFLTQGRRDEALQCHLRAKSLLHQAARGRLAQAIRLFKRQAREATAARSVGTITVPRDAGVLAA